MGYQKYHLSVIMQATSFQESFCLTDPSETIYLTSHLMHIPVPVSLDYLGLNQRPTAATSLEFSFLSINWLEHPGPSAIKCFQNLERSDQHALPHLSSANCLAHVVN